jgi:copper transport protein
MGAWGGLAGSVLGAVLLQGVYGAGQGIGHVFWPNVLHATLYSRYGRALGIRLLLVIVALFVFTGTLGNLRVEGRRPSVTASATWGVLAAALAATWAAADHAGTGMQVPLSLVSDTAHLCAVALWLGGLTMLATIVLRRSRLAGRPATRKGRMATADAAQAVERFSPLALGCVGLILLTGTYQAWRGVGSWPALVDTTYGRLLLVKIGAICVLIGLGYLARMRIAALRKPASAVRVPVAELVTSGLPRVRVGVKAVQRIPGTGGRLGNGAGANGASTRAAANGAPNASPPDPGRAAATLGRLRWSVAAEAMIAAAVLGVTAVLVNTPTARETFTPPASETVVFKTGGPGGRGSVSVTMTPAVLGPNRIRVSVTGTTDKPYRPQQIEMSLELPARHLGPLAVALAPAGPGQYVSAPVTVTLTGRWQLRITVRSDASDETTVIVPVSVRSP